MVSKIRLLLLWLCLPLLHCAKEVTIDLPEQPVKLVAICHFTTGEHFKVKMSLSQDVNDASNPVFLQSLDATLSLNGEFWDRLKPDTSAKGKISYWESNRHQLAVAEKEYSFSVRVQGYPAIQAVSKIPKLVPLEHIVLQPSDITIVPLNENLSEMRIPLELKLSDMPEGGRYFAFNLTHQTDIDDYTEEGQTNFLTDGRTFSLLHDIPEPVVLVNENYWADNRRTLYLIARIPFKPATDRPRRIFVEWRTLSEDFYRYHLSLSRQSSNLPFSDPDAVYNNIQGGYGNFSGYAVSIDTVEIPNF